ncbi:hypothetical protein LTR50_005402 [Elasticomyces elasticus]|nr:hypothetical protein LTR50_005402 [Elasticomyces elasticus]
MPEKPLTVAAYAAGASAAAITLFYVLGPTFFLDDNNGVNYNRKKGVVGLRNPANDCFINSILQTLAGLPELRYFLIRELHRRSLDGVEPYDLLPEEDVKDAQDGKREVPVWKTLSLQHGVVSIALKDILNALNERPICKKTISAQSFVRAVEEAFRTRINRSQQDAQEFLQLVIERVLDEWYAARKARRRWRKLRAEAQRKTDKEVTSETMGATEKLNANVDRDSQNVEVESKIDELERSQETIKSKRRSDPGDMQANSLVTAPFLMGQQKQESRPDGSCAESDDKEEEDESFPFEGKLESQIECQHCHFKPKPSVSTFVILPLSVPQTSSTSLNTCLDGLLKQEHIDDFKCDRCRLVHALESKKKELSRSDPTSESKASQLRNDISAIEKALFEDPEQLPKNAGLPDMSLAPQRRITRHTRISNFPDILSIHLSRSIFVPNSSSTKNTAKVSFPESFPLGGLLDQHRYRLLGVVTHKGGHNSGHYESFRRQTSVVPFSTPANFGTEGIYSAQHVGIKLIELFALLAIAERTEDIMSSRFLTGFQAHIDILKCRCRKRTRVITRINAP